MNNIYAENYYQQPPNFEAIYNSLTRFQMPVDPNREAAPGVSFDDYPFPYVIGSDNEELRAQTQSIWDQWGNAAIRSGSQLVLGTLKAGADIPDLFRAFFAPEGLAALADEEFSNDLSQAIANAMDSIKESTPIYLERDERGFVPWKAAWWANNMESIVTGVSMLVPTMGAAKGATWIAKMVGKAMQGSKSANLIMGKHSTAMVGSIIGALYGNAYESMLEMGEVLPGLKETLLQSGKSEEETNKILKEEAGKMYWGNLPNAALDMLGIYQLTKPFGGELVETSIKKRLAKTTALEVVPEGLQELRNHYVSERSRASVNKIAGLRSTDYSLSEFVNDMNAWTSGFFGALGGAAFAGGANTINQISENLSDKEDKRSWNKKMFSNVGRATLTGITKGEQKIANKQKEVLDRFAVRQQKLEELKTISELAGNKELYDSVKEEMTFLKGLEHLNLGTFDRFMKHIDSVEAQLKGLQQDEAAKANPALLKEAKDSMESLAKLKSDLQKSKRHYNKGIKYYGLDTARLFDYTAFSVSLEKEKERLDKLVAGREEMFAEDEFGILRTTNSPKIEELKTKIAELETALTTGTSPDSVREKSILAEIQSLKREVEESTDARTLDDEVQLNIAQASLNIKELEHRIKNVLKDKNYKDSGEDYFDDLYNEEKIKDLIFNAYNSSKFSKDVDIDTISKELVTGKVPLSEASRDKVLSLIDAKLSEVRSSFYEKIDALIREEGIDPNTLEDEELAELEEKYRKQVENAISTEVNALQDLKNLAIRRTNFNPKRRTVEELIHSYIVDELKEVKESFKDIQDDETNTDLKTLSKLIDRLVILKSAIAATRYPVSAEDRKDVNDAIEEAKKLGGLIATRLESQSKDQTLILNKFMNDLIDIINAVRPFSGDITAPIIDASLKAIAADKATVKAVEDAIAIKAKEFREASVKLVNPTSLPLFQAQPGFSEVASETTPEQYLMSLMSVAYASANAPNQREYELTLDHNKILVDEVNKDVVQAYDELIPFVKLLRMLKSDKSFTEVITAIREDAKETGEYPFPDQLTTLIELSMWYSSSVDISYIQGIAGSGKTNLISKHLPNILNKLYKLDKKEIQALSNSPNTDRLIRKAVFGIEDIREIVTNDPSKLKAALANAKFLILDEIGKFSHLEIDIIHDALYGADGLITTGHRLKILLTGDPNQFVNSTMSPSILPALNGYLSRIAHRIQIISPLTFSIRANNTEIVEFQNKFLKAGKENVFTNGTVFTTSYDSDDQNGVRISPDRDTLKAIANKKLQAKENFVIIVEAEANKSLYKEFEADGVKRVYTFEEAQGSEWDSVLVDIQNYKKNVFGYTGANKMLYTAFSRAKNYIFMLTTALNENKPFNGLENQEVLEKLLNINEAKINANKINIEEGFDNLLGTAKVEEKKPTEEAKPEATAPVETPVSTDAKADIEITDLPSKSSKSLRGVINTKEDKGHFTAMVLPDGTAYISDIQIGYDENASRGKGYGFNAYTQIGKKLKELGYTLESTQWDKHTSGISPQALRVWEKLEKAGYARVVGRKTNKVYNRETGEEVVKETNVYEFIDAEEKPLENTTDAKADIAIGRVGNTNYEVKSDGVYFEGKKLDNPKNLSAKQFIEEHIKERQQEELKNSKIQIPRYFTFKELGGAKGKSGKALSSIEDDRNEEIQQDFESKLQEGDKLIEPNGDIYYFKNGKVVKSNGQPRGMADIGAFINGVTIDRTDKINAKYDAELKALKQSTSTTESESNPALRDVESTAEETPHQEEEEQKEVQKLNEEEEESFTAEPIPGITLDKKGLANLLKSEALNKGMVDVPWEGSNKDIHKKPVVIFDEAGNIYYIGNGKNIPGKVARLLELGAVKSETVKVTFNTKYYLATDGSSVRKTRQILSRVPSNVIREAKWKSAEGKKKTTSNNKFEPSNIHEAVVSLFAGKATITPEFAATMFPPESSEYKRALAEGFIAPDNRMGTKGTKSKKSSAKAADDFWNLFGVRDLLGIREPSGRTHLTELQTAIQEVVFSGMSRKALRDSLREAKDEENFNAENPYEGLDEEARKAQEEHDRLSKAEHDRLVSEIENYEALVSSMRATINAVAREYFDGTNFNFKGFIEHPAIQELLPIIPDSLLQYIQSLEDNYTSLVKKYPRYDGVVKLKRNRDGSVAESTSEVAIVYRALNPSERNKDKVIHKVYLLKEEFGYTELAVTTVPDTGQARLNYATDYTIEDIDRYVFNEGGYFKKGKVINFAKRKFIYNFANPVPFTIPDFQRIIEDVFKKSADVINRRTVAIRPVQLFVATDAAVEEIQTTYLDGKSALKLLNLDQVIAKELTGDGHELIMKRGNPYALIAIDTSDLDGTNIRTEYKVVELAGKKMNLGSSTALKDLGSLYSSIKELETILENEFNFTHKYASTSKQVEIEGEVYHEGMVFKNILHFKIEEESIASEAEFDEVAKVHEAINKHPKKVEIINALLKVKDGLYKHEEVGALATTTSLDFQSYEPYINEFVTIPGTKVTSLDDRTVLNILKDPSLHKFFKDKGYKFVLDSSNQRVLEARRTFEVGARSEDGVYRIFHVLVSIPFEKNSKTIDGWTLSAKAAPIIEIFKLQDITSYEDYLKKPNNEEAKASALHRGRDGKMFEKNKIFDSSTSTIPMQAGLAGLEDIQDVVTQVLTKTRKVKQLTAADEAINAIAKANGKIWIDENTYVKIQRKKIKTYGSGGQKTSITFGPNLLGSEVIFPLFRVVQKEGKLEEEPVFMSSEVVNGKEIVSQEGLDLRDLLELIFNPDMYDSQGNSMHNRSYTSIDGSPAKVGLREAIQDRPIKRANEVMNGSIDPASEEGQIGLAEMDKLAIPLVKFEETFVDIEESLDTIAVVTTPNLPVANASDEQIVKDVLDTFSLDEDPDDTVPFFHIDEASIGNSNLITEDQAIEYITRYIPGFDASKELRAAIGSVIIGMQKYGPEILGAYKQGIVYLTMDESSNIELEVLRHELFHKIFDTYLPEHVKKALMAHVRAVTKVAMTDIQVEEYLARKFQAFTVKEEESDSKLLKFFTWLKNLIKSLFSATIRHEFGINHIFEQIESGAFNRKVAVESTGTKFMKDVTSLFPARTPSDSQKYSMKAINLVKYALLPYINNQDVIEEAAGKVWQDLMTRFVEGIIKHPSIKGLEPAVRKEIALGYLDPSKSLTDEEKLSKELVKETHLKALDNVGTFDDADMLPLYYLVMFKGRAFKAVLNEVLPNKDLSQVKLREIYEDIIKSIPEDEAGEDNTVTENRNNFHEEYMQNATINQETRISKELKILLSFVERPNTFDFLPSRYAYAKTIESLMYLNTTGQIRDALNKIKAKDKTSNEALLASHLLKVYERSIQNGFNYKGTFYETKNTAILKAVTFRNGKFQVYNREVDEFGRTEQGVLTRLGTTNYESNVISILRREDPNLDEDFARAALKFIKVRDFSRDVMAKIYHELGSQVEVMPVVDQSSLTLGAYDELDFEAALAMEESLKEDFYLTTYNISAAGVKENIVASTRTSLQDLVLTKTKDEIKELASKAHSTDLINILKMMGVSSFVGKTFTSGEQANIRQKYKEILNSIVLNYEEAKEDAGNIRAYLNATNFKSFTDIFTKNADFLSTLSYKGADGNTRYTYVVGSWVYDVLGALNEGRRSEYLLGEGYIAKNNYYIQKTSGIKNTADFDKMKQKNSDFDAVAYKNMGPGQFLAHRFMYSFIGTITRGKGKDRPTYIQYSFIQSNRNADTGIETNVMKFTEMKTAFEMAKAMEMARPKSLEKNVNYSTDKLRFMQYATFEDFRKAMSEQALKLFPEFIENMELVPGMSMTSSKGRRIFNTNEAIKRLIELGVLTEARVEFLTNYADKAYNENIRDHAKKLLPLWELFFMQNYIGTFHLTTAVFGDLAFAKDINDLVKRMQGVNSPGRKQLVTDIPETPGNKVVSKMQVVKDSMFKVSELNDIKKYFSKIYGTLTATDGYTLGIPMTLRGIHKGTGDYNLKDIIKVVSFYVDPITNETRYLKSALFIITDELARMFPGLKSIRKKMESKGLTGDKLTRYNYLFEKIMNKNISPKETAEYEELTTNAIEYYATESALKIGRPKSQYLPEYGDVNEEGVIDIQNRHMRIQSNPFHEEGSVADPSQFNYFINVNGKNEEEAFKVYSKIEEILSLKQELLEVGSNLVTLDASGQGVVTERALRNLLINQMKNTPSGDDKVYNMLKAGVNINYPAVISKAIIALMNTMSRNSVELRHSGNKLVSQSAVGVRMFSKDGKVTSYNKLSAEDRARADKFYSLSPKLIDFAIAVQDILQNSDPNAVSFLKANLSNIKDMHGVTEDISSIFDEKSLTFNEDILVPRRLQMRDSEGYTEIIAPKWWLDKLGYKIGDKAFVLEEDYKKLLNTGMAVRIPTTGIHSAIAFKIVGSTEEGYNRIIAPEELVAIHGSDFDIDALFAIRREMFDDALFTSKVLEKIQDRELLKFIEESSLVEVTRGELVGYSFNGKPNTKFKKDLDTLLAMENLPSKVREIAITMKMKSVMNEKLDIEMSIITAAKNREDVNTPISFELIKHDLFKDDENLLKQALTDNKLFEDILYNPNYGVITKLKLVRGRAALQPPRDPFNIMDQMRYHKDNFEGAAGVGIQASISKAVSYMMYGTPLLITKSSGQVFSFTNNEIQDITYISEDGVGRVTLKNGDVHEGTLSREPVNIPNKFRIKFGKKYVTYDSFTTTSRLHGHKTYELADTVLNGYLDNVKEQITWIMNATPITIEPIAYMIAIGIDLDLIALILNQSSLKEYAASKMAKESRLSKTVKRLISVLKDSPVVEKAIDAANVGASKENTVRKLEDLLEMNTLSFENLATALNYEANRGKTFSQLLDEFDNAKSPDPALQQYLLVQLQTLNVFQKLMQDGAIIGNVARGLDILRQFKITPADLYKKNQDLRNLSTNLGKFGNVSFFDIPNIRNARNAFDKAMKYYRDVFPIYSEEVEEAMNSLIDALGLTTTQNTYKLSGTNYAYIHGELQSLVASMVAERFKERIINEGQFFAPPSNTIDTLTGLFVMPEDITSKMIEDGQIESLNPEQAYVQIFLERLRQVKNEFSENMFLASLNIVIGKRGLLYLDFHKGSGNNPEYDALVETHFSQLSPEVRNALIYYDLYYNKAKFGFRSYSHHMGPQVSAELSDMYVRELTRVTDLISRDENFLHYLSYLLLRNEEVANYSKAVFYGSRSNHGDHIKILKEFGVANVEENKSFYKTLSMPSNGMKSTFIADGRYIYMLVGAYTTKAELISYNIASEGSLSFSDSRRSNSANSPDVFLFKRIDRLPPGVSYPYDFNMESNWINYFSNMKALMTLHMADMNTLLEKGTVTREYSDSLFYADKKGVLKEKDINDIPLTVRAVAPAVDTRTVIEVLYERQVTKVIDPFNMSRSKVYIKEFFKLPKTFGEIEANYQKVSVGTKVSKETLKKITSKLSKRFGIKVEYEDNPNLPWSGMFKNGKVYINLAKASLDTPYHEFTHPFIAIIKKTNPSLYASLVEEVKKTELYERVKESRKDLSYTSVIEESIVEAIGLYSSELYQDDFEPSFISLLKEFLQFISELLKELLRSPLVNPTTLSPNMTLKELAALVANTNENNKIDILGEYEKKQIFEHLTNQGLIKYTCKI